MYDIIVIASAAIPGILNPVVLMRKRADGSLVPFSYGGRGFKDGSLRADIPIQVKSTAPFKTVGYVQL